MPAFDIRAFDRRPSNAMRGLLLPWVIGMRCEGVIEGRTEDVLRMRRQCRRTASGSCALSEYGISGVQIEWRRGELLLTLIDELLIECNLPRSRSSPSTMVAATIGALIEVKWRLHATAVAVHPSPTPDGTRSDRRRRRAQQRRCRP